MFFFFDFDFFGRDKEIEELNSLYKRSGFKFAVVYGRRRVGKSSVMQKFIECDGKPNISYMALEQNDKLNLESFSQSVLAKFPVARSYLSSFATWENALDYIAKEAGGEKLVLFIDEYPYLAKANKAISSILQKYADGVFRSTNIMLVLCGSSMSFMEKQVLGAKSPLYGRRDMQFKIEPFDYYESAKFFAGFSPVDKALAYGVTGGIPLYLNRIKQNGNVADGIKNEFLKKNGSLYEEPRNLLMQELREPSIYNAIIRAIASGATKPNEIALKAGEDSKKVSKYLSTLISLHLVQKEVPVVGDKARGGIYKLSDNMFRFWYRFVIDNNTNIEAGMKDYVYDERILPVLTEYMGRVFEDICIQYLRRKNKERALPFVFDYIGRWWGNNPVEKRQEEIDIIAYSGKRAIFGECKWTNGTVGTDVLASLKVKAKIFGEFNKKSYYLFSKSGFSSGLTEIAKGSNDVVLVDLNGIFS
ncbi:MAG: ATP-binding protein [Firmicutes bacterium]|nr:ATP-binding protein [Bacillota bacterium]